MWTHEIRPDDFIRQQRERLYREQGAEIVAALRVLAKSHKPLVREFGQHWLDDYQRWTEHVKRLADAA